MSKEGSPDLSAVAGIVPAADLKALLKDSLLEILRENPALLRPLEEVGSGSRSGKPSCQCTVYGSFGVCVLFMHQVLPVWERHSGMQAGGWPCPPGIVSAVYDGVSTPCCLHRVWPGCYARPNSSGRARAASC